MEKCDKKFCVAIRLKFERFMSKTFHEFSQNRICVKFFTLTTFIWYFSWYLSKLIRTLSLCQKPGLIERIKLIRAESFRDFFLKFILFILNNRHCMPLDRVGWFRPITDEYFAECFSMWTHGLASNILRDPMVHEVD